MRIDLKEDLIVDVFIHVTILFIFLYIFFYTVISKTGERVLNSNIKSIVDANVKSILQTIDDYDKKHGSKIDWEKVKKMAQDIKDHPDEKLNKEIEDSNNYYKRIGIIIIASMILLCIFLYCYFSYKGVKIDIVHILKENAIVFLLIGIIEFIFFMLTGSNYIPSYPTAIGKIVLDRVKYNVNQKL